MDRSEIPRGGSLSTELWKSPSQALPLASLARIIQDDTVFPRSEHVVRAVIRVYYLMCHDL